jgi:hypothetical protein
MIRAEKIVEICIRVSSLFGLMTLAMIYAADRMGCPRIVMRVLYAMGNYFYKLGNRMARYVGRLSKC